MISEILIVCEGNICRSPMAQGLLAHALPGVEVISAGLSALVGERADPLARSLMAERGIDIGAHVGRQLELDHVRSAQIVLAMTRAQCKRIEIAHPFAIGKVYRLGHKEQIDVVDPYRLGRDAFEACLGQIECGLEHWLELIGNSTYSSTCN
ncbi:low molecular weight protein-tyrosine-phosphatase [Paraburkholderia fungorum]|uniref:protein-tyrosine-phosphatase n=1 Tax=Paraburkholderia fungorum TaxID=134537 RepID=A0A3R7LDA3_9BURK|nr:low molecular weight protein-tyrosine-phosphatase [Paraburkholderia fungorum]RKF50832.1 protein tyrosine phosphatase [Paraburkholderia fungorum]